VFVSNTVYDHVRDRLPFVFEDLGEQQVKNIARPVRVYRVRDAIAVKAAAPSALPLPDKPSIAVLPFANLSGDPEQEYFADGMVEEIITALSRIRWLFVIAETSSCGVCREYLPRPPQTWMPSSFSRGANPRFSAPITLVVMPEECQSMPITAPNDWNQNGWARRRNSSSRP
jgi:hypothetical protein